MDIVEIKEQEKWDSFVAAQPQSQFAQSLAWGGFQAGFGHKPWYLAAVEEGQILAAAKFIKKPLFFGWSYFYCDRGPVFQNNLWHEEAGKLLFREFQKIAMSERAIFLRFDPVFDLSQAKLSLEKTIDIQPKKTAILDLSLSEEELLGKMHQKTRYNIRLAQKKGVEIKNGKGDFEIFWQLMEATKDRDGFRLHSKSYYQKMLELDFVRLHTAWFAGKMIAGVVVVSYGDMATYVHGASSNEQREVMAPYLLQWTAMLEAKAHGLKHYDLYGVDENKWPGVTRFKMGFNPCLFEYPGTYDLVYKKASYAVYGVLRMIRRKF
jgi:lipid II:glycine glycyltransferase (peptidoglycan interpeptide bridge formation enzyme)